MDEIVNGGIREERLDKIQNALVSFCKRVIASGDFNNPFGKYMEDTGCFEHAGYLFFEQEKAKLMQKEYQVMKNGVLCGTLIIK